MNNEDIKSSRAWRASNNGATTESILPVSSSPQKKPRSKGDKFESDEKLSPRLLDSKARFSGSQAADETQAFGGYKHRTVPTEEEPTKCSESDSNIGSGKSRSSVPGWPDRGRSPLLFPPPTVDGQPPKISPRTNKVSPKLTNSGGGNTTAGYRNGITDSSMPPVSRTIRWGGAPPSSETASSLLPPASSSSSGNKSSVIAQSNEPIVSSNHPARVRDLSGNSTKSNGSNQGDGVFMATKKGKVDAPLVVYRSPAERNANPERLNLDKRHLVCCPVLRHEERVRLLNYQNNYIVNISNLEGLPNLIFLDLYNNSIEVMGDALSCVPTLRVLMLGKNRITKISNLERLSKLDVLDLHSNGITSIQGLSNLSELRVLNLAGNKIEEVTGVGTLSSLTELNVRRNKITTILDDSIDKLMNLQRIFMSNNMVASFTCISGLLSMKHLTELTLDGNPIANSNNDVYRRTLLTSLPSLKDLDLKKVSDSDKKAAVIELRKVEDKRRQVELREAEEMHKKRLEDLREEAISAAAGAWVSGDGSGKAQSEGSDPSASLAAAAAAAAEAAQGMTRNPKRSSPRGGSVLDGSSSEEAGGLKQTVGDDSLSGVSLTPLLFPAERRRPTVVVPSISMITEERQTDNSATTASLSAPTTASSEFSSSHQLMARFNPQQHRPLHSSSGSVRLRSLSQEGTPVLDSEKRVGFFEFEPPLDQSTDKGTRSLLIYGNAWECLDLGRSLNNVTRLMVKYVSINVLLENLIPHLDAFPRLVSIEFSENALENFNQLLSIITVRQFRTHPSLSELTITDNVICELNLLRLFVAFNMGQSLQKFNGTVLENTERESAHHLFSPLFQEVSDTKITGDIPCSPIPPKRKKHTLQSSSPFPLSKPEAQGAGSSTVTLPQLTRGTSTKFVQSSMGTEKPLVDLEGATPSTPKDTSTSNAHSTSVVWKPFKASSKLMTFELNDCARDMVSKSFSRAVNIDAIGAKFEQAWVRAVNMLVSSVVDEIETGSGEDLFEKVVQPRRR